MKIYKTIGQFIILILVAISIFYGCKSQPEITVTPKIAHNFKGKVIIVGAGAAGLSAANVLEENGVSCQILEATAHYGGRIGKLSSFADFPMDKGAEWIHEDKTILNKITGKAGGEPEVDVILYQPKNVYSWYDQKYAKVPEEHLQKEFYTEHIEYKFKSTTWYDFIDTNFAQKVKQHIVYNAPVTKIDYTGNKVQLTTKNGQQYTADKVIVTVSLGVLKSNNIVFQPQLPDKKVQAIHSVYFPKGFKLFMKFSEKFYPDAIVCETTKGEKTFFDVAYHKGFKDHVLGLLSVGDSAEAYYQLESEKGIVANVLEELDVIFKGKASQTYLDTYYLKDWTKQPYVLGTYTDSFTSDKSTLKWLNAPLGDQVYFAGETYDTEDYRSTVHGAILSGYKTAREILLGK